MRKKEKTEKEKAFVFDVSSVNKKGQIVIPAKIRKKIGLKAGSKLLIISGRGEALVLIKARAFADRLRELEKASEEIKLI